MRIKVSDASGPVLDWLVCVAEYGYGGDYKTNRYSSDWSYGGPIIDREYIELTTTNRGNDELWEALGRGFGEDCPVSYGPTALIAAMRCYVMSKLGEEVDVPDELMN